MSGRLRHIEHELQAATAQAWELRTSPYFTEAIDEIVDLWDRAALVAHERRQRRLADLLALLGRPPCDPALPSLPRARPLGMVSGHGGLQLPGEAQARTPGMASEAPAG